MFDTDVLVVGAGPVGLALAIELGTQGRRCVVIERHDRVGYAPRAKTTNIRSRELMRRWGIADRLAAASPFGVDYPSNIVFATRLNGHELARFSNAFYCAPARDDRYAEHAQWIPQYKVEEVLRAHAASLPGVEIRFGTSLEGFRDEGTGGDRVDEGGRGDRGDRGDDSDRGGRGHGGDRGVIATLADVGSGRRSTLRARYLVGADGARSTVREQLGIRMEGRSPLSQHHNIIFRSPGLSEQHRLGPAVMYWLVNPEVPAVVAPLDSDGRWTFGCPRLEDDEADPVSLIRRALGFDAHIDIVSRDQWTAHQLIAERYRAGNVFLAGDACHLHPPFGGYGMNMGIGDAVDLGWKLAAVLKGWGSNVLLDSYEIERRPIHRLVVDEAVFNLGFTSHRLVPEGIESEGPDGDSIRAKAGEQIRQAKRREFDSLGVVLGAAYGASPILSGEADEPRLQPTTDFRPTARAGSRAPHAWVAEGRARGASLFDHFATDAMTMLVTTGATDDMRDAEALAHASAVPLRVVTFAVRELYQARYALIRPDQHVAWRGDDIREAAAMLQVAAGHRLKEAIAS